jgi:uncharacterized membrane protein YozB (DUF420 family)
LSQEKVASVLSGPNVILALKVAVVTVTILLLASLVALAKGNQRLHGRINIVFFVLTLAALVSLEVLIRFIDPGLFAYFDPETRRALTIHLCFSLPAAALLPLMLYTGLTHRRRVHLTLAMVFSVLWIGTFITGVFCLPHGVP